MRERQMTKQAERENGREIQRNMLSHSQDLSEGGSVRCELETQAPGLS